MPPPVTGITTFRRSPVVSEKRSLRETGRPPSMATASSPARVLVVEEQVQSRSSIDDMPKKRESSPVPPRGGEEAIAHIEGDPPFALVLSDLMMAGWGSN